MPKKDCSMGAVLKGEPIMQRAPTPHPCISWKWGVGFRRFALVFGFLSMILGISQVLSYLRDTAATQSATSIGDLIPLRILFSGLKVTLIPTIYGSIIYLISLIVRVIQKPRL